MENAPKPTNKKIHLKVIVFNVKELKGKFAVYVFGGDYKIDNI